MAYHVVMNRLTGESLKVDMKGNDDLYLDLAVSIEELRARLVEVMHFKAKLDANELEEGDQYLSFAMVLDNGYDRTGPQMMEVITVEKKEVNSEP